MRDANGLLYCAGAVLALVVAAIVAGYHDAAGMRDFAAFLIFVGLAALIVRWLMRVAR